MLGFYKIRNLGWNFKIQNDESKMADAKLWEKPKLVEFFWVSK